MPIDPLTAAAVIGVGSSLVGGHFADKSAKRAAANNLAQQERFAKEGIQWKVKDAKAAGVSPEYALGASTSSFSPTYTGSEKGSMIADAGQNIARSVLAAGTKEDRLLDSQLKAETLRGMTLQNNKMDPTLTSINSPGNPAFPHPRGNVFPGQGNSPVVDVPLERTGQARDGRHSEGASIPSVGWAETSDGGLRPVPSQDIKNRIEDQMIPESLWAYEHMVKPNFGSGEKPPNSALPKGYNKWNWNAKKQAYYPGKKLPKPSRSTSLHDRIQYRFENEQEGEHMARRRKKSRGKKRFKKSIKKGQGGNAIFRTRFKRRLG